MPRFPPDLSGKLSSLSLVGHTRSRSSERSDELLTPILTPQSPKYALPKDIDDEDPPAVSTFRKGKPVKRPTVLEDTTPKTSDKGWPTKVLKKIVPATVLEAPLSEDIFVPIDPIDKDEHKNLLPYLPQVQQGHHPISKKGIRGKDAPINTNKFYANTFLRNQDQPVWTHPYHIWWGRGSTGNQFRTWGMNVGHIDEKDLVMSKGLGDVKEYSGPRKRQSLILTAMELRDKTVLTTHNHGPFSVEIHLTRDESKTAKADIEFPVVQGMSFVSSIYNDVQPVIQCPGAGFKFIGNPVPIDHASIKHNIVDADNRTWLLYVKSTKERGKGEPPVFTRPDRNSLVGPARFRGVIQIAKNPLGDEGEAIYNSAAGTYVKTATLSARANDERANYTFTYEKEGTKPLLIFALPHHVQSLDPKLESRLTKLQLRTTTKGVARAIFTEKLTCVEPTMPVEMYSCRTPKLSRETLEIIESHAINEWNTISLNQPSLKTPEGLYDAGRHLSKIATLVFILKYITTRESSVGDDALKYLKTEIARFAELQKGYPYPFAYDGDWYGVVSYAAYTDNPDADFQNVLYNEHHSVWSYFVYTAACIALCDIEWLKGGERPWENKKWVSTLVKDYAESDYNDRDFPFSRCFDWWHGHSWCTGLSEREDGKEMDSCGEDGFASWSVKLWGKVIGDTKMEHRGNLMLALQARSFQNYFFIEARNANHPPRYAGNNLAGILSENKVQHATYFGDLPFLTHGRHMAPISPATPFLRQRSFVKEE